MNAITFKYVHTIVYLGIKTPKRQYVYTKKEQEWLRQAKIETNDEQNSLG